MPTPAPQPQTEARRVAWVLDDSPLESEMARRALEGEYDVELFPDGSAVLEAIAARNPPDVLICDWVMPNLTGIEVCQFLRGRPETEQLAVLLLTMNQQTEQIVEGLHAGANDYLRKPYAAAELRARVGALIRSRTMRERAEHAERLLRKVLSQLPDAVITINSAAEVVFANAQALRVFNATRQALVGKRLPELSPDLQLTKLTSLDGQSGSLPDVQIGGHFFSPRVSIPPSDDEGNTTLALRDVTELREKETRRVDFYSMVAHDLRSPLTAVQMRGQMLLQGMRGPISAEVRQELDKMNARVRELVQMVNDFLDIAQMETPQFRIEHEKLDLAGIAAQVYEEYQPLAAARGLQLTLEAPAGSTVVGDDRRLTQVAGNLVSNALKFTPSGGRVALRVRPLAEQIEVAVVDSGRGIPEAAQGRLFTKYERVGGSTAAKIEGTGLGLVIVKEIVEAHGGTVGVSSREGEGSTFWFRLPRA